MRRAVRSRGAEALRAVLIRWARGSIARRGDSSAPPKVYFLLMHPWGMGGTIRTTMNTAAHLAQRHEVEVLGVVRTRERPFFDFPANVPVVPIDDTRKDAVTPGARGLVQRTLKRLPSVLYPHSDRAARAVSLWTDLMLVRALRARTSGVLIGTRPGLNLITAQVAAPSLLKIGQEHMHLGAHKPPLRKAIRAGYPALDAVAVLTEADRHEYSEVFAGRVRVDHIPNAVTELDGGVSDVSGKTVLAAGRLMRQKDFGRLIRSFAIVAAKYPDWQLRICGGGPRKHGLQKLIGELGLEQSVTLAGPVRNLGEEMANAAMYAMSSRREGFPMVLLEAMGKGLPVVSFDCPTGPREIIRHRENGLLVPHQDVEALAAAVIEMIEDEDLRRRCGAGALATAERYSIDVIGARWEELLAELGAAGYAASQYASSSSSASGSGAAST
jgi:glycosyltransferase involved in cell wall biosynthesis